MDRFATWLLAGTGAVMGLLLANYGDLAGLISPRILVLVLLAFFLLAVFATIEKVLAVAVESARASAKTAVQLMSLSVSNIREEVVLEELMAAFY